MKVFLVFLHVSVYGNMFKSYQEIFTGEEWWNFQVKKGNKSTCFFIIWEEKKVKTLVERIRLCKNRRKFPYRNRRE